eukprot:5545940-Pyramimonas_sp.AAC.1
MTTTRGSRRRRSRKERGGEGGGKGSERVPRQEKQLGSAQINTPYSYTAIALQLRRDEGEDCEQRLGGECVDL